MRAEEAPLHLSQRIPFTVSRRAIKVPASGRIDDGSRAIRSGPARIDHSIARVVAAEPGIGEGREQSDSKPGQRRPAAAPRARPTNGHEGERERQIIGVALFEAERTGRISSTSWKNQAPASVAGRNQRNRQRRNHGGIGEWRACDGWQRH